MQILVLEINTSITLFNLSGQEGSLKFENLGEFEDSNQLKISYKLNSFMDVMSFANLISDKSEQIKHHPKIIIDYNVIEFNLTTHDVGGISKLDFQLATFIHETYNELFTPDL